MKNLRSMLGVTAAVSVLTFAVPQHLLKAETSELDYQKISQEAERNRELLEIWKEHVKTLTKERDDAYQQLEHLKASGGGSGVAQFGGMETMPLASAESARQIQSLQSEVSRLQAELQQAPQPPGSNRDVQMQLSALQRQFEQVKQELGEARADKDKAISEKERAMSQVDTLNDQITELRASKAGVSKDEETQNLQLALDSQRKRYEDLQKQFRGLQNDNDALRSDLESASSSRPDRSSEISDLKKQLESVRQDNGRLRDELKTRSEEAAVPDENAERKFRELQRENETLKAQVQKLEVTEKELSNTRAYFNPLVRELQDKNDKFNTENAKLRGDYERLRKDFEQINDQIQAIRNQGQNYQKDNETLQRENERLKAENQKMTADSQGWKGEQQQLESQLASYKAQLQTASADREKFIAMEQEFKRKEADYRSMSERFAQMERENNDFKSRQADVSESQEKYRTAVRADLQDMRNLKSNFEAYLESLIASFEERQR